MWEYVKSLFGLSVKQIKPDQKMMVLVTGCDSGLGYSIALRLVDIGFTVVAGFLQGSESEVAMKMRNATLNPCCLHQVYLDITNVNSVSTAIEYVENFIKNNPDYFLYTLVNNAGVMIFGEFEWQNENTINLQTYVNVLGTFRITKASLPLLRRTAYKRNVLGVKPKIVIVNSHCGMYPLPILSVYSSTKAALKAWSEAIRMELKPIGINVINFLPGNMFMKTNLVAKQLDHGREMEKSLTQEQRKVYGDRIEAIMKTLANFCFDQPPDAMDDVKLLNNLTNAILDINPWYVYLCEPLKYTFYYNLIRFSPYFLKDWLIEKFMQLPKPEYNFE